MPPANEMRVLLCCVVYRSRLGSSAATTLTVGTKYVESVALVMGTRWMKRCSSAGMDGVGGDGGGGGGSPAGATGGSAGGEKPVPSEKAKNISFASACERMMGDGCVSRCAVQTSALVGWRVRCNESLVEARRHCEWHTRTHTLSTHTWSGPAVAGAPVAKILLYSNGQVAGIVQVDKERRRWRRGWGRRAPEK